MSQHLFRREEAYGHEHWISTSYLANCVQFLTSRKSMVPGLTRACRVVIADDHPLVTVAVGNALSATDEFAVTGTANSGDELLHVLQSVACDLVVTDFVMAPDKGSSANLDGMHLLGLLRRSRPQIPVVVLTMIANGGILKAILKEGVQAIVSKEDPVEVLIQICRSVAFGAKTPILSPKIALRITDGASAFSTSRELALTHKENEVVRLFAQGLTLTQISQQLNRAITTVATQKRSAMRKLHLATNADLIRYAVDTGMV